MKKGYVYILSNYKRTAFSTGVTSNLARRWQTYREENLGSFVSNDNLKYLVYFEELPTLKDALRQEKRLKNCRGKMKINLIKSVNPDMRDLSWAIPRDEENFISEPVEA